MRAPASEKRLDLLQVGASSPVCSISVGSRTLPRLTSVSSASLLGQVTLPLPPPQASFIKSLRLSQPPLPTPVTFVKSSHLRRPLPPPPASFVVLPWMREQSGWLLRQTWRRTTSQREQPSMQTHSGVEVAKMTSKLK